MGQNYNGVVLGVYDSYSAAPSLERRMPGAPVLLLQYILEHKRIGLGDRYPEVTPHNGRHVGSGQTLLAASEVCKACSVVDATRQERRLVRR